MLPFDYKLYAQDLDLNPEPHEVVINGREALVVGISAKSFDSGQLYNSIHSELTQLRDLKTAFETKLAQHLQCILDKPNQAPVVTINGNASETVPVQVNTVTELINITYASSGNPTADVVGSGLTKTIKYGANFFVPSVSARASGTLSLSNAAVIMWNSATNGSYPTNVPLSTPDLEGFFIDGSNTNLTTGTIEVLEPYTYNDLGATALDAEEGPLPVTTSGTVDTTTAGVYTLTYSATDSGTPPLTGTTTRTVTVGSGTPVVALYKIQELNGTVDQDASVGMEELNFPSLADMYVVEQFNQLGLLTSLVNFTYNLSLMTMQIEYIIDVGGLEPTLIDNVNLYIV